MNEVNYKNLIELTLNKDSVDFNKLTEVINYLTKNHPSLLKPFKKHFEKYLKSNTVTITSAVKLNEEQKKHISSKFKGMFYDYKVENILGGLIVQVKDEVYDDSLSSKIDKLK